MLPGYTLKRMENQSRLMRFMKGRDVEPVFEPKKRGKPSPLTFREKMEKLRSRMKAKDKLMMDEEILRIRQEKEALKRRMNRIARLQLEREERRLKMIRAQTKKEFKKEILPERNYIKREKLTIYRERRGINNPTPSQVQVRRRLFQSEDEHPCNLWLCDRPIKRPNSRNERERSVDSRLTHISPMSAMSKSGRVTKRHRSRSPRRTMREAAKYELESFRYNNVTYYV